MRIFVNIDSQMWHLKDIEKVWTVVYLPADVGDTWTFERDGLTIEIGSCSANFDGLELVEYGET